MATKSILICIGSFFILGGLFVIEGNLRFQQAVILAGAGMIAACLYLAGTGRPRKLSGLRESRIYEILQTIQTGKSEFLVMTKDMKGNIMMVKFPTKPDSRFVKILDAEKEIFEAFPPSENKEAPTEV